MMHSAPLGSRLASGGFFGGARSLHIAAGSGQEEARFRPCHGREDAPAAFLRPRKPICPQLPTRGLAFSDWALSRTRRSQNAHGFGSGPSAAEKIFLFKKHSKYAFFAVRRRPPLGGSKQFRPPPAPKSWRGTKGEAMPSQSLTACKPCFRHATAHAESKPSSSVSRTSTLERARPSTGDAARNEAAAHRIKRAAGRG